MGQGSILIIDDREPHRRYLRSLLDGWGYATTEADSTDRAVEIIQHAPPDLVLMDVLVPDPAGYEFVLRMRQDAGPTEPKVVFLFAPYMEIEARRLAQACGVVHLISSQVSTTELHDTISRAMAEPPLTAPGAQMAGPNGALLSPVVRRLYGRVAELESFSTRLERQAASSAARLALTRGALDREVFKRLWSQDDLTEENKRLRDQSVRDPLTGLYNRRFLEESLALEESRTRRSGRPFCVMMIDIDHFKRCNDTFGHAAGDEVLRTVSRCMESLARPEDVLCRYGGEEFVLVLTNLAPTTLWQRADTLRASVPRLNIVHGSQTIGPITLSIGLATFPDDGGSAGEVLRVADSALYLAKTSGRNRVMGSPQRAAHAPH